MLLSWCLVSVNDNVTKLTKPLSWGRNERDGTCHLYQWTFQTWGKFLSFSLFLIVNLPSPTAKMNKHFFIFQTTRINNSIFIMRSSCTKVPHGYLNIPPNGAHWNSKPYIDDLLFNVLRVRSITTFNMFHVLYINQVYNILKKNQQMHLDLQI
jgi:hypothetical protein